MQRYDYFDYKLPDEPASYYAGRVIPILKDLRRNFPKQFKENFRCPSEVLTLSGVRAFDTYYDLGEGTDDQLRQDLATYLQSQDILLVEETFPFIGENNKEHRYSLVHVAALAEIPKHYGFVPEWQPLRVTKMAQPVDFYFWWMMWKERIGGKGMQWAKHRMPKRWYDSWSAVHNITFGMLLGYPGEAICSCIISDEAHEAGQEVVYDVGMTAAERTQYETQRALFMTRANIAHADKYDGAQPVYDFEASLRDWLATRSHEKLWSDILSKVYAAVK